MLLFLLSINLPSYDLSIRKFEKYSMNSPVLIYFLTPFSTKYLEYSDEWTNFSDINKDNQKIYTVSVSCSTDTYFCNLFSIHDPALISIYNNFYQNHQLTNYSIQTFEKLYEKSLTNSTSFCNNFILNEDTKSFNYPTFIFIYNDIQSCNELSKFKLMFPNISFYIKKESDKKQNLYQRIEVCYSPSNCIRNSLFYEEIDFIREYLFDNFGQWSLSDVSKIRRRLVLIVYDDSNRVNSNLNKAMKSEFDIYIQQYSNYFLFGLLPYSNFSIYSGKIRSLDDTPFMLITNTKKTRFMVLDHTQLPQSKILDKLNSARQGFLELDMQYFFDSDYSYNEYNPHNMLQFFLASLFVIFLTAFLILLKACKCIRMFNHSKHMHELPL